VVAGVPPVAETPFGAGCNGAGDFFCAEAVPDDSGGGVPPAPDCSGWLVTAAGVEETVEGVVCLVTGARWTFAAVEGAVAVTDERLD
jgi:hypothetical protein